MTDESERDPVEMLAEEFLDRRRRNEAPTPEDYAQKYPDIAEKIRAVFPALMLLDELSPHLTAKPEMPKQLGEFRIIRQIGRGGMGVVYEAVQQSLDRRVALKVLPAESARDPVYLDRFRSEARTAARLHHTNIVAIHGAGQADGVHFLVMQLIEGVGLDAVIRELRAVQTPVLAGASDQTVASNLSATDDAAEWLDLVRLRTHDRPKYYETIARLTAEAADALAYAHQLGVIHRDVKPSNFLLDRKGSLFVSDFGLAKVEGSADLTRTGQVVGTPRFVAPERLNGVEGPASDVFALGATLYELLTLKPAFDAPTRERLNEQIRNVDPVRPRIVVSDVPRDLETLAMTALVKEPGRRPSAAALAEDLHRWLGGRPIYARRIGPVERLGRWARRNPVVASLTLGLIVALSVGLGVALSLWRTSEGHRQQADDNALIADRRREQSEATLNQSLDAMDEYFRKVSEEKLLHAPGMQEFRKDLMTAAMPYYETFVKSHGDNPRLRVESFRAAVSLARIKTSVGKKEDAAAALEEVLAQGRQLSVEMPDNLIIRRELARSLESMARVKVSLSQIAQAAEYNRAASEAYARLDDFEAKLRSIQTLLSAADNNYTLSRVLEAQSDMKDVRRRLDAFSETLGELPNYQVLNARAHLHQASYLQKDSPADALKSAEQALAIMRGLDQRNPGHRVYQFELARALQERANAARSLKQSDKAKESLAQSSTILERLAVENPLDDDYPMKLVVNYRVTAQLEQDSGRFEDGLVQIESARRILERLLTRDSNDTRTLRTLAEMTARKGLFLDKLNRHEESLEANGVAADIFAKLYEREPQFTLLITNFALCRRNQALSCMLLNKPDDGAKLARESVDSYLKALAADANSLVGKTAETRLYPAYRTLIDCHLKMDQWDLVEADIKEVLTVRPLSIAQRVNVAKNCAEIAGKTGTDAEPMDPERAERFERLATLAVETLRTAAKEDIGTARKEFKFAEFQAIKDFKPYQDVVDEFRLPTAPSDKKKAE